MIPDIPSPETYLRNLARRPCPWIASEGPFSHTVISSRIRLARNLAGHKFPHWANPDELDSIGLEIHQAILQADSYHGAIFLRMEEFSPRERNLLKERHLISHEMTRSGQSRSVFIPPGEEGSVMINEEDHLRVQVIEPGLSLAVAWNRIQRVNTELEAFLNFSFSAEYGYLTTCPSNTGTGLRASVMMHLPGLVMTGGLAGIIKMLQTAGLAVRGFFGEGSEAFGDIYQISNQVTLGQTEEELIRHVDGYVKQVAGREMASRKELFHQARAKAEDAVFRACGILTRARMMSTPDALQQLSYLRLGVGYGLVNLSYPKVDELGLIIQPAHLQILAGQELDEGAQDILRAECIRNQLAHYGL